MHPARKFYLNHCPRAKVGDEAVGDEAVVLVVADDEVIEKFDVEDVACFDEFGGYFFVGLAGFGVAGWVVVDDHDGVCVGKEGSFVPRFRDSLLLCSPDETLGIELIV